jgi:Domain of unknown function (DUF4806)
LYRTDKRRVDQFILLKTLEDLDDMETKLQNDDEMYLQFIDFVNIKSRGTKTKKTLSIIIKRMFDETFLLSVYNWSQAVFTADCSAKKIFCMKPTSLEMNISLATS